MSKEREDGCRELPTEMFDRRKGAMRRYDCNQKEQLEDENN
jgi:hypothetical protein